MTGQDLLIIAVVFFGGVLPPIIWLWFWLKEDAEHPEPRPLIIATFIGGMIAVPVALYFEQLLIGVKYIWSAFDSRGWHLFFALAAIAAVEEVVKYLAALGIAFKNRKYDEPVDAVVYMVTVALGFAGLENTLFLIRSFTEYSLFDLDAISVQSVNLALINNNLRFIGANILHVVASGFLGVFISLAFYKRRAIKILYMLAGLSTAIILHGLFNFYIMTHNGTPLAVFSYLWVAAIVLILLFEKAKRVRPV